MPRRKATERARREGRVRNSRQARKIQRENQEYLEWDDNCTRHTAKMIRRKDNSKWTVSGHGPKDEYGKGMGTAFWKWIAAGLSVLAIIMEIAT